MKKILVPTDFSDISLNAVRFAADLAKKIEEKSEKVLKFLQIEPRGLNCTEKHQKQEIRK